VISFTISAGASRETAAVIFKFLAAAQRTLSSFFGFHILLTGFGLLFFVAF